MLKKNWSHKSKKVVHADFHLGIIPAYVNVIIANNWDKHHMVQEMVDPGEEIRPTDGCAGMYREKDGAAVFVVALKPPTTNTIIVHECVHLMFYISEEFDLNISPDNQEVGSYMVQNLFLNIQHIAKKHKAFKK